MRFDARRLKGLDGSLFHGQIRFHIHVSCGWAFVPEPQGNDSNVDTRLQHVHCSRVPYDVGRDLTFFKLRAVAGGCCGSKFEAIRHPCSSHRAARAIWKERAIAGELILT